MLKSIKQSKQSPFVRALITVGVPVTIQNFIETSLNLIDTVMIGRVGKEALAGVGLANQVFFLMMLLSFGVTSGVSVYIAQFWGKKDTENIRKTVGVGLLASVGISILFFIAGFFFPEQVLRLFLDEANVVKIGAEYLRIVSLSYVFTAVTLTYSVASRGVEQARLPMMVSAFSILLNTVGNFVLIFGLFGFPAMGAKGAAIATLISRTIEMCLLVALLYKTDSVLAAPFKSLIVHDLAFVKKIFKTAFPVIVNEGIWALGMIMYTLSMAKINSDAVASYQMTMSVYRFFEVAFIGMGNACQVVIGNRIGADEPELAIEYSRRFIKLTLGICAVTSIGLFAGSEAISSLFKVPENVMQDAVYMMRVIAFYNFPKMMNLLLIVGILRGGGDTFFAMLTESFSVWGVGVPLAFVGALVLHLPPYGVMALYMVEEFVKVTIAMVRFKSGKWVKNVVHDIA